MLFASPLIHQILYGLRFDTNKLRLKKTDLTLSLIARSATRSNEYAQSLIVKFQNREGIEFTHDSPLSRWKFAGRAKPPRKNV